MSLPSFVASTVRRRRHSLLLGSADYTGSTLTSSVFALTANGSATTTLTATVTRNDALASGETVAYAVSRTFVSASQTTVTPSVETLSDNGTTPCTITAIIKNADGTVLPGVPAANCVLSVSPSTGVTITQPTAASDQTGAVSASFVSTNATVVTCTFTILGTAITDTASVTVGTPGAEPTPSGTIFYDFRAGGAQSFQTMTSVADVNTAINAVDARGAIPDGEQVGSWAWASDYNGSGKKALRVDWPENSAGPPYAQSSVVATIYYPDQYTNVYTSFVMRLGKTASGGGLGSNGAFTLNDNTGMKRFMWLRNADNGTDRLYFNWPQAGYGLGKMFISCDNLNLDIPIYTNWSTMVGADVRWTFQFVSGSPSTVRVWRDGTLICETTNAGIGTLGFEESQFVTTRLHTPADCSEYLTDLVMWTV